MNNPFYFGLFAPQKRCRILPVNHSSKNLTQDSRAGGAPRRMFVFVSVKQIKNARQKVSKLSQFCAWRWKTMRRRICITVSDKILSFIEENDLKKSAFFEAAALLYIAMWKGERIFSGDVVGPRGFEPRTSRLSGGFLENKLLQNPHSKNEPLQLLLWEKERLDEYAKWAKTQLSQKTAKEYANALKKLLGRSDLLQKTDKLSKNQRLAIRSFAKFLLIHNYITDEDYKTIKNAIELSRSKIDTRIYTDEDIQELFSRVKNRKHLLYIRLLVESGLRRSHAIAAWRKIIAGDYKVIDDEIAVVNLDINNGNKRAFVCLCSKDLAEEIQKLGEEMTKSAAQNLARRRNIVYNAIRKWWYTKAIDAGMDAVVADFVQGRTPGSVGAKHYLNAYSLAIKQYKRVLLQIREVISVVQKL